MLSENRLAQIRRNKKDETEIEKDEFKKDEKENKKDEIEEAEEIEKAKEVKINETEEI